MYTCIMTGSTVQDCDGCNRRMTCAGIDFATPGDAREWLRAEIARTQKQIERIDNALEEIADAA